MGLKVNMDGSILEARRQELLKQIDKYANEHLINFQDVNTGDIGTKSDGTPDYSQVNNQKSIFMSYLGYEKSLEEYLILENTHRSAEPMKIDGLSENERSAAKGFYNALRGHSGVTGNEKLDALLTSKDFLDIADFLQQKNPDSKITKDLIIDYITKKDVSNFGDKGELIDEANKLKDDYSLSAADLVKSATEVNMRDLRVLDTNEDGYLDYDEIAAGLQDAVKKGYIQDGSKEMNDILDLFKKDEQLIFDKKILITDIYHDLVDLSADQNSGPNEISFQRFMNTISDFDGTKDSVSSLDIAKYISKNLYDIDYEATYIA